MDGDVGGIGKEIPIEVIITLRNVITFVIIKLQEVLFMKIFKSIFVKNKIRI